MGRGYPFTKQVVILQQKQEQKLRQLKEIQPKLKWNIIVDILRQQFDCRVTFRQVVVKQKCINSRWTQMNPQVTYKKQRLKGCEKILKSFLKYGSNYNLIQEDIGYQYQIKYISLVIGTFIRNSLKTFQNKTEKLNSQPQKQDNCRSKLMKIELKEIRQLAYLLTHKKIACQVTEEQRTLIEEKVLTLRKLLVKLELLKRKQKNLHISQFQQISELIKWLKQKRYFWVKQQEETLVKQCKSYIWSKVEDQFLFSLYKEYGGQVGLICKTLRGQFGFAEKYKSPNVYGRICHSLTKGLRILCQCTKSSNNEYQIPFAVSKLNAYPFICKKSSPKFETSSRIFSLCFDDNLTDIEAKDLKRCINEFLDYDQSLGKDE